MRRLSSRWSRAPFVAALLAGLTGAGPARAGIGVSIRYDAEEHLELATRISSELGSEGYTVELTRDPAVSPCGAKDVELLTAGSGTKAWIRLQADPSGDGSVVASICFLGSIPLLQRATSRAPSTEPQQLALATAEALNGLRSRLPAVVDDVARPVRRDELPLMRERRSKESTSRDGANSVALGMAVIAGVPDIPSALGVDLKAALGITPVVGLAVDVLVPTRGAELTGPEMTVRVRTAWVRLGPRLGGELGDFHLSGAALAGPALTWATAVAAPPRRGTTDWSSGAVLSLSGLVEYPARSPVFASAAASASLLLPGTRVSLGDGARAPRSSWPIEASIGLGARWGGGR